MKPPYYFNTAAKHIADKTNNTTAVIARITPATLFFSIKRLADVNALTRQPARNINGNIIPLLLLKNNAEAELICIIQPVVHTENQK